MKKILWFDLNVFRVIFRIFGNTILIVLVLLGTIIAISLAPIKNNFQIMSVTSGSMQPALPIGSLIVVKPVSEYRVGDIITFLPSKLGDKKDQITHRIISIQEKGGQKIIVTKGDANNSVDGESVAIDKIIGKELFLIPLLGYALLYIKTLPGLLIIVLIPSIIIIYEEIKNIGGETKSAIGRRKEIKKRDVNEKIATTD